MLLPDAVQRVAVHRRAGIVPRAESGTVPGPQRTIKRCCAAHWAL